MPIAEFSLNSFHGLVDMGSNGIRFSITELSTDTARSLPVVFQERLGISLYDAQYSTGSKGPIPQSEIDDVVVALKRFKAVCDDFGVPDENIRVLATEATRTAVNSDDYQQQIKNATGWDVNLLTKEDEGRVGAMGIASSFDSVDGLVMDLGGGSTQFAWLIHEDGEVTVPDNGSVSFPYGAAAMTKLLADIDASKDSEQGRADLKGKIQKEYKDALETLQLPNSLAQKIKSHGLTLYLSGGGFRGWGYILMSQARKGPYPIPIINGYQALVKDFADTDAVRDAIKETAEKEDGIFRVSKRRASQVPAVSFLVNAICEAFPFINDVRFAQGGVREGYLFSNLPSEIKAMSPLSSATSRYAIHAESASHIASLLSTALPVNGADLDRWHPSTLTPALLRALVDTMYVQLNAPKESASLSALCLPITGVLAAAHGIAHGDRALLSLALCQRWDGDLPPPYDDMHYRISAILTDQEVWWAKYLGTVAALLGDIYPSGKVHAGQKDRTRVSSEWASGLGKKGNQQGIALKVSLKEHSLASRDVVKRRVDNIEDMSKKKNRAGGKEYGFGLPVEVDVEWV